jgi:heme A synthase
VTIAIVIAGTVAAFTGIILGQLAIGGIVDAAKAKMANEQQMFSSINAIDPPSPSAQRTEAFRKYKDTQPHGPLIKRLRVGQLLTVAGCLIMVFGFFI